MVFIKQKNSLKLCNIMHNAATYHTLKHYAHYMMVILLNFGKYNTYIYFDEWTNVLFQQIRIYLERDEYKIAHNVKYDFCFKDNDKGERSLF